MKGRKKKKSKRRKETRGSFELRPGTGNVQEQGPGKLFLECSMVFTSVKGHKNQINKIKKNTWERLNLAHKAEDIYSLALYPCTGLIWFLSFTNLRSAVREKERERRPTIGETLPQPPALDIDYLIQFLNDPKIWVTLAVPISTRGETEVQINLLI